MIDNQILKTKLKKELKDLKLDKDQEELVIRELNYLSNLLIEVYIKESKMRKFSAGVSSRKD